VGLLSKILGGSKHQRGSKVWRGRRLSPLVALPFLLMQCVPSGPSPAVPGAPSFGDGRHRVGPDIAAGLYFSVANDCYWERLSGFSGGSSEIITNDFSNGQHVVLIEPGDVGFGASRCGRWTWFDPPVSARVIGDGDWDVRAQMGPGLWVADPSRGCYWERAAGYTHETAEIITNDFVDGQQAVVQVLATDVRFSTQGCSVWRPFNPPIQAVAITDGDWDVRAQMGAGRWQANPSSGGCYWERASGYLHDFDEVIDNDFVGTAGPVIVDVSPSDVRFSASGCGRWTRIG